MILANGLPHDEKLASIDEIKGLLPSNFFLEMKRVKYKLKRFLFVLFRTTI